MAGTSSTSAVEPHGELDPTTGETDSLVIPEGWEAYLRREDLHHFQVAVPSTSVRDAGGFASGKQDKSSPRRFAGFDVDRDEYGEWTVADHFGAAMGVGTTPNAALREWEELAAEQYRDLVAHAARLHPRLHGQCKFLSSWFGR